MKKTTQLFIVLILLISIHHELQAGKKRNYSVSEISPQLLIKANSVMRYYKETVERTSLKSSITKTVYAVTVLNAAGKDAGYFIQPYFKYSHVGNITATIFDKNGKKIKKVAAKIREDYEDKNPVFLGILKGSFIFLADLVRAVNIDCEIDFLGASSYGKEKNTSGVIKITKDISFNIKDRCFNTISPIRCP